MVVKGSVKGEDVISRSPQRGGARFVASHRAPAIFYFIITLVLKHPPLILYPFPHSFFAIIFTIAYSFAAKMVLKRKRSSDFSPASSTSSWSSSSTRASQSPTPHSRSYFQDAHSSMDVDRPIPSIPIAAWNLGVGRVSSTDMNSRTRKRFRDNRPDEEIIHGMSHHGTYSPFINTKDEEESPNSKRS